MTGNMVSLCILLIGVRLSVAAPESAPIAPDTMAVLLNDYARKVDSLSGVLSKWPIRQAPPDSACVSGADLCEEDRGKVKRLLSDGRELGRYLEARGGGSFLSEKAYSDTLLPRVKDFRDRKLELPPGVILNPVVQAFEAFYEKYISNPVLNRRFMDLTAASRILMERKYLAGDEGNFLEGNLNGHIRFTRTDPDPTRPNFGVSPWEFLFRFEPIYLARDPDPENLGVLLDLGLLAHFFPKVGRDAVVKEGFWSECVRRTGLKAGGGLYGSDLRWVAGGGVQISALSGWWLYDMKRREPVFAMGISNLALFKKMLPFLGKP